MVTLEKSGYFAIRTLQVKMRDEQAAMSLQRREFATGCLRTHCISRTSNYSKYRRGVLEEGWDAVGGGGGFERKGECVCWGEGEKEVAKLVLRLRLE